MLGDVHMCIHDGTYNSAVLALLRPIRRLPRWSNLQYALEHHP